MVYWKNSYVHQNADAEKVFAEIESLDSKTPANIVEMATKKRTEIHKCFTWEDGEAAEAWRIQEARLMVNHLVIEYDVVTEKEEPAKVVINALTSVSTEAGREYIKTTDGLDSEVLKEMIISEVASLLSQAKNKMRSYKMFFSAKHFEEVEDLIDKIAG